MPEDLVRKFAEYEKIIDDTWSHLRNLRISQSYFYRYGGMQVLEMTEEEADRLDEAIDMLSAALRFIVTRQPQRDEIKTIIQKISRNVKEVNPDVVSESVWYMLNETYGIYDLADQAVSLLADFINAVVEYKGEIITDEEFDVIERWVHEETDDWLGARRQASYLADILERLGKRIGGV